MRLVAVSRAIVYRCLRRPALRRAQALAGADESGIEIARDLLTSKVAGQLSLLPELPGGAVAHDAVVVALRAIESTTTLAGLLTAEAQGAQAYWQAWSEVPVSISAVRAPKRSVPAHWHYFGQRRSTLTSSPRSAVNPANALLNYCYSLLESEATIACHLMGLDPGLGIFHTDRRDRDSLALDAMEAARPAVDAYVLALLTKRTLTAKHFGETRAGACRLTTAMSERLTETMPAWRKHVAAHVERIAHRLRPSDGAAPLTRAHHRASWERRQPTQAGRPVDHGRLALPATCRDCGDDLPSASNRYCVNCRQEKWRTQAGRARQNAAQVLTRLQSERRDPRHGGEAAKMRGEKNRAHQLAVKAWTGERPDPSVFEAEILPGLREATIAELTSATGLSEHYCSLIRLGKRVPHPRHWDALRKLDIPIANGGHMSSM